MGPRQGLIFLGVGVIIERPHRIPNVEETIFDSGSARNLIKRSLVTEFPDYITSTDQVVHLTTAAGPEEMQRDI